MGLGDKSLKPPPYGVWSANHGISQRLLNSGALHGRPVVTHVVDRRRQRPGRAASQVDELLLQRRDQAPRLGIHVGCENIYANHGVRLLKLLRRLKLAAIYIERLHQRRRGEMGRECKRQAEHSRQLRAERARSEQPDRDSRSGTRHRPHRLIGLHGPEQGLQFQDIMREILGGHREIAAKRARRALIGAGGAAQAEIDTALVKRFQRAELFGNDQRRVVRQHDTADPTRMFLVPPAI